jgi:diadenosine tetraphosphate (Ap4A) HIT family hydrolase/ADP-ribose pyrophosphatase YjhB (NUDIX family)
MHPSFALLFLINVNNEILLLKRTNTPFCNQFYCLPGSEIELNETSSTTIIKEAQNSIGIDLKQADLKFMHVMHRKCNEAEFFACIFKPESWQGNPTIKAPEKYDDLKWFPLDKLPSNIVSAHLHAIEQIQQNQTYSEHGWSQYGNKVLNMNKANCLFCQRANQKDLTIVSRLKHCFVIKDNFPVSPGHVLIIPNKHFDNWFEATQEVQFDIMKAISETKKNLDLEYNPDGYNIGMNCGQAAGQTVMHLHVHLIPRYKGDMVDPRGGVRGVIPSKQKYKV